MQKCIYECYVCLGSYNKTAEHAKQQGKGAEERRRAAASGCSGCPGIERFALAFLVVIVLIRFLVIKASTASYVVSIISKVALR